MKREDLEKTAAKAIALISKSSGAPVPAPGTPDREMVGLAVGLLVDTLSLLDRAVVALERIAAESRKT